MYKLFVFACMLAMAAAAPNPALYYSSPYTAAYTAPLYSAYTAPLYSAYTAPLAYSAYTAPLAYSAYTAPVAYSSSYSYSSPYYFFK